VTRLLSPPLLLLLAAAALAAAWWLARRFKRRYRQLLAAVELVQRQATELRSQVDETRSRVEETLRSVERLEAFLATRLEPELERLGRHAETTQAAAAVRRAAETGRLDPAVARQLLDHLADLDEEIAAGGRPY
jgi:hypothetical protein